MSVQRRRQQTASHLYSSPDVVKLVHVHALLDHLGRFPVVTHVSGDKNCKPIVHQVRLRGKRRIRTFLQVLVVPAAAGHVFSSFVNLVAACVATSGPPACKERKSLPVTQALTFIKSVVDSLACLAQVLAQSCKTFLHGLFRCKNNDCMNYRVNYFIADTSDNHTSKHV